MSLIELLYTNKTHALTKQLTSGANPNVSEGGESLLYCAIDKEKWSLVKLLLNSGASPNLRGTSHPLALAAAKGRADVVEALLKVNIA